MKTLQRDNENSSKAENINAPHAICGLITKFAVRPYISYTSSNIEFYVTPGGGVTIIDNGLSRVIQTSESLASQDVEHVLAGHDVQVWKVLAGHELGKILCGGNCESGDPYCFCTSC
jgi:hypothetical protein